ncbi:hypothetical protein [Nitrosarchaeum sp. AC2]|uniref:hypothetical protein n=1 Tax=Nitrosarchaeum sp. AC2 TaxID=2259673 RepID=UPI0015DCE576|nr:hypothetical protein [Nitrosarchaeum sp. AC2]QLH10714.1 hypothetical protein DSQ20_03920 [Nitrosarchaeum sp. AC2]
MKCPLSNSLKKRRAVSQVMGSVVILGVVTSIGSVVLFNGMNQINAFSYDLTFHDKPKNEAFRENLMFEHVRFEPGTDQIILYLANIGTTESTIESITVVKIDTQNILVNWDESVGTTIQIKESSDPVIINADLNSQTWDDPTYRTSEYKISITTSKGNFFSTVASPYNT